MSRHIWKYPLALTEFQSIAMPEAAVVLDAQLQQGELCLWAEVVPGLPLKTRKFVIIGTGQPFPDLVLSYIATVQQGVMVWHLYEVV